jgi:hypothetical protein
VASQSSAHSANVVRPEPRVGPLPALEVGLDHRQVAGGVALARERRRRGLQAAGAVAIANLPPTTWQLPEPPETSTSLCHVFLLRSTTVTLKKHALRPLYGSQSPFEQRVRVRDAARASRCVAAIFEPAFDVVNPVANVPADAISARSVTT